MLVGYDLVGFECIILVKELLEVGVDENDTCVVSDQIQHHITYKLSDEVCLNCDWDA